jgi:putative YhdH/YhfP family quinone oxidoreductase
LGYDVHAVTGKPTEHDWLRRLGATTVLGREALADDPSRPLLAARWAAAVDTVGGLPLAVVVRSLEHRGCVAACGLVAGTDVPLTVYPFLLRGITLAGIDSAKCPRPERLEMWNKLAGPWRVDQLEDIADEITFDELPDRVNKILAGQIVGRTIIAPRSRR